MPCNSAGTCVEGREGEPPVPEPVELRTQVPGSAIKILKHVGGISHTEASRRGGHELGKSDSAFAAACAAFIPALLNDKRVEQTGRDTVTAGRRDGVAPVEPPPCLLRRAEAGMGPVRIAGAAGELQSSRPASRVMPEPGGGVGCHPASAGPAFSCCAPLPGLPAVPDV